MTDARDNRTPAHAGLRHVALNCRALEKTVAFYTELLGMKIEWNPDPDNYYLTSGNDNLALHRASDGDLHRVSDGDLHRASDGDLHRASAGDLPAASTPAGAQRLDHIGFILNHIDDVDLWHARLIAADIRIVQGPKTHRDGARSLYCLDPDGTTVQMIYHPPLAPR